MILIGTTIVFIVGNLIGIVAIIPGTHIGTIRGINMIKGHHEAHVFRDDSNGNSERH